MEIHKCQIEEFQVPSKELMEEYAENVRINMKDRCKRENHTVVYVGFA